MINIVSYFLSRYNISQLHSTITNKMYRVDHRVYGQSNKQRLIGMIVGWDRHPSPDFAVRCPNSGFWYLRMHHPSFVWFSLYLSTWVIVTGHIKQSWNCVFNPVLFMNLSQCWWSHPTIDTKLQPSKPPKFPQHIALYGVTIEHIRE